MAEPIKLFNLPPAEDIFRILVVALAVILGVLLIAGAVYFFAGYRLYENKGEAISIRYPAGWKVVERPGPGAIVGFVSPKEGAMDTFQENVSITTTDISKTPLSLAEYTALAEKQMTKVFGNIQVRESLDVLISGRPAHKFVFEATGEGASVIALWAFIDRDIAYTITYIGRAERYYRRDKMVVEVMISTLKLVF
jgi:hypothetical protein